jgi:hypothetical protein
MLTAAHRGVFSEDPAKRAEVLGLIDRGGRR